MQVRDWQLANKNYYCGQNVELRALDQVEFEAPRGGTTGSSGCLGVAREGRTAVNSILPGGGGGEVSTGLHR